MHDVTNRARVDLTEVERDGRVLLSIFSEVLVSIGKPACAACLPLVGHLQQRQGADHSDDDDVLATTIGFHLLGLVEERAAARYRGHAEAAGELESGLWRSTLNGLVGAGVSKDAIVAALRSARVEAVFTAHPTEARRVSALESIRELFRLLPSDASLAALSAEGRETLEAALERLFRSGEVRVRKPDLADERAYVLDVVTRSLPAALDTNAARLRDACERAGIDVGDIEPRIRFATWVGGDRDGHPFVTGDVTRASFASYEHAALELHRGALVRLASRMGLSSLRQATPPALEAAIAHTAQLLGEHARPALDRNSQEPIRTFVNLMLLRLPDTGGPSERRADAATRPVAAPTSAGKYRSPDELVADLETVVASLRSMNAHRLARIEVMPVVRQVRTFGFHLLTLDIRQNSRVHELAMDQLLAARGSVDGSYSEWPEQTRMAFLRGTLASGEKLCTVSAPLGAEARVALEAIEAVADRRRRFGDGGLGNLIVSMTRSVSDLLAVLVLAREAGLFESSEQGPYCPLPVVPLFETIDDLERAPAIVDTYLAEDIVQRGLRHVATTRGLGAPVQTVMVGYSDSNKDGGVTASLRALHVAERAMLQAAHGRGVELEFFHGRGGSLSRGAGPTHRFLSALPMGALEGGLRLTEQGETIVQKYGNRETAAYNLELLTAGTVRRVALDRQANLNPHGPPGRSAAGESSAARDMALDEVARQARRAYESFVGAEGFVESFREATPIDVLETSGIGSRPSRRTGQATMADLRAIPWVFAWSQARFGITGWYGLGSGLTALEQADSAAFRALTSVALEWAPFRYIVANVSVGVLATDLVVARAYAELVTDDGRRARLMDAVESELALTRRMLEVVYGKPLEQARHRVSALFALRAEALRAVHRRQVELLARWRSAGRSDEQVRLSLLGTVNAIAAGLRTTG